MYESKEENSNIVVAIGHTKILGNNKAMPWQFPGK
jgi:hypothetical protein